MSLLGFLLILFGVWVMAEPAIAASLRLDSISPLPRLRFFIGMVLVVVGVLLALSPYAKAATAQTREVVRIPDAAAVYRRTIEQASADVWGVSASPARLAAQIHQESRFNPKAHAYDGGEGLAQFMPDTTAWIADQFPERLGRFDPWDANQAVLAAAIYDQYLHERVDDASTPCDSWAFALSSYNGGLGWLNRDRRRARDYGSDPNRWFGQVELRSSRSAAARATNRDYVRRILLLLEPAYIDAGWSGSVVCS